MNRGMTTKQLMLFCTMLVLAAFSIFVMLYQNHVRAKALFQINDHANIIASSLWTFEESSPTAYLTLAAKANGYERIVVKDDRGRIFIDISGPRPTKLDEVLLSTNLIPIYQLESMVEFEGRSIGKISAAWPCRTIYTYMYILFCVFLLLTGIWLFLRLLDSNRTLESRVRQRTAELEKENSERKRTEEAFRLSEERLRLALDGTFDGIWDWNLQTGQMYFSPRYYTMMGYEPGEFPAAYESWRRLLHPDDLEPSEGVVQKAIENHSPFAIEFRFKAKSGEWRWILGRGKVAESDFAGKAVRMAGSHTDITERKRAEEALRKYERIVSTSQDLMALVNRDYVYEAVNESYLAAHQRPRIDVVGRTVPEVMGESVFREMIRSRLDQAFSGHTVHYQSPFDFVGLGRRIMDVTYFPMFEETGKVEGVVVNSRDITETRRLEEQLMQSQKIESIGTLAGGVAHEINNPINGIMNYAQLILDRLEKGSPAREFAREILTETQRIARIVRNLLTFARHEKQSHSPALLSDIVSAVLSLIQAVMRRDQIDLQVEIPEDLPKIKCRSQQIQQVLMNLMTNARDALNDRYPGYSPEKTLRITGELIIKQGRRFIRTTVEDTGAGIPVELRDRIFDPFFTTKPKETGTGLGLSISYGITRDHGGELSVESEPGRYTRFHMDLPVDNGWTLAEN
jgi:PAS domain S-box-containing protein